MLGRRSGHLLFLLLASLWITAQAQAESSLTRDDIQAAIAAPSFNQGFKQFLGKLPQVEVPEAGNAIYYIVEGDLLLDEEGVQSYLMGLRNGPAPARGGELRVMTEQGRKVIWSKDQRKLTYAVDRASFPTQQQYQTVVQNMRTAAKDWMFCSECGVSFVHQSAQDSNPKSGQVTFIVRYSTSIDGYFAVAFFPSYPVALRYIYITPRYFTTDYNPVGILRHELGHVLGYQHEQVVGVPGCAREGNNWTEVSPYDPKSVMHYLCGGGGTKQMALQDSDKAGHRATYGE
ncbi:hypothetical protein N5D48_10055 [Pseudomonas sp. GD03858]|uniref:hypothetical protein n=1 Tax=unclassified Pseudomonas TaxID=196821 RepID=UPI00244AF07F|nr:MULTISPECIES: hypothetical protein [unclassified Pseudomonas]MDH0647897.1 hypothetical protein [Pseudomonas sp. GD03867]MDH0662745.1 hypothetical protein [Pseudomonas sp. GD03858]